MDQRLLLMHQMMLADRPRMRAYDDALCHTVSSGSVVVDVGAGTLALTLLALRHGAGHVYAIEADPQMVDAAERLVEARKLKDRVTVIAGDARAVRLEERADVLVGELMGNLGPEESMAEVMGAVARRNLKPGGAVIPQYLRTMLTPIQFDGEGWGIWDEGPLGDGSPLLGPGVGSWAQLHFFQRDPVLLGAPVVIQDDDLGHRPVPPADRFRLRIDSPGRVHAVMGHFVAGFQTGGTLANFPSYTGCNWAVWIWPLRHTTVVPGDEIAVEVRRPGRSSRQRLAESWRLECGIKRRKES
jgi:protein arginine N-methyltransferase 1